jgi:carbonic anhydrase/acetyltransferase-like protein (isoleucine patch superfamily)
MNILPYEKQSPQIGDNVFIAPNAAVIGAVKIGAHSNIWYSSTVRGDEKEIVIGKRTNIQDNSVIHVATMVQGTYIGDDVTIGHSCIIHACTIGNMCLIGMGSTVMDGAKVEDNAMVAAGSLVTPGKVVPSGQLWAGRPAKYMRHLTNDDMKHIKWSADNYIDLAGKHIKAQT